MDRQTGQKQYVPHYGDKRLASFHIAASGYLWPLAAHTISQKAHLHTKNNLAATKRQLVAAIEPQLEARPELVAGTEPQLVARKLISYEKRTCGYIKPQQVAATEPQHCGN
ncbi:hypothetical protein DPMN_048596 [Dreissena polymorpha]|uniref:Uncharacterized protein n=1 Tax=Dreissena polymorpha TaxID=45954 RepID=A0A9D4I446_DREPO|nr:hypothetical protein DPMN_048596 [Dreissena polymorpha]